MSSLSKSYAVTFGSIFLVLAIAGFYTWYVIQENEQENVVVSPALQALSTASDQSSFTDLDGNPVVLSDFVGQVLVVQSWASWCPTCVQGLKLLSKVGKDFVEGDVKFIAINRAESSKTARSFLETIGASDGVILVLDPDDRYFDSIGGFSMPETVFYDTSGNIVRHQQGVMSEAEMRLYIDSSQKSSRNP